MFAPLTLAFVVAIVLSPLSDFWQRPGEALATVSQRTAQERVAWALLRVFRRLRFLKLGNGRSVPFPYRQQDLSDALGLSLVHTNKTLAALREKQLVS